MDRYRKIFESIDLNQDGYVDSVELRYLMNGCLRQHLSNHVIDEMIRQADHDGDGLLSLEEFCQVMKMTEPPRSCCFEFLPRLF